MKYNILVIVFYAFVPKSNNIKSRHGLMLLWFTDLMNVTKEVTIHRPNV